MKKWRKESEAILKQNKEKMKFFREIEHLKTSSRLLENRMKKKMNLKAGGYYPLKIEVWLTEANLTKNKDSILSGVDEEDLEIYFKMDNGKDVFKSNTTKDIFMPRWNNFFSLILESNQDRLYFQIFVVTDDLNKTERLVDTFDINASIIEQYLRSNEELTDNISTSISNQFTLFIKNVIEINPKLQANRDKIQKLEDMYVVVEPPYKEAREKFEKFLNLKGAELLEEWGICGTEMKLLKKSKTGKPDGESLAEESKIIELDLDQDDRSFIGGKTMKIRPKRSDSAKKSPEKSTKHSIMKNSIADKYAAPTAMVNLDDIGEINILDNDYGNPINTEPDDKIKKRIEKKHLYKPYKTSATIHESEEIAYISPEIQISPNKKEKSARGIAPVKQLNLNNDDYDDSKGSNKLTSDALRTSNLGNKRTGLGSSLINFAMEDVTRVNKVKSEYNSGGKPNVNVGNMFKRFDMTNTLSGMLMVNNGLMGQPTTNNQDEDNCSLVSGATLKTLQHLPNPMMSIGSKMFNF